ncbi:MAG TPA: hypothetical protein VK990_07300 [Acidimicrobiia bacterium]|nr:hypothetical protein [Acidimicrobiia bacterium]
MTQQGILEILHRAALVTGLLVTSLVLAGWSAFSAQAAEEGTTAPGVSIEVTFEDLDLVASSPAPIRVEVDQAATVTVVVLETDRSGPPPVIEDPSTLFEIEDPSGSRIRFADLEQVGNGEYRADFILSEAGTWRFVALPDLGDRSLLPPGSTDVVVVIVDAPLVEDSWAAGNFDLSVVGGVLLVMVALVLYVTRHKLPWNHTPRTPSFPHDTE